MQKSFVKGWLKQVSWVLLFIFSLEQVGQAYPVMTEGFCQSLAPQPALHRQSSHNDVSSDNPESSLQKNGYRLYRVIVGSVFTLVLLIIASKTSELLWGVGFLDFIGGLKAISPWSAVLVDGVFGGVLTVLQDQLRRYIVQDPKYETTQGEPRHPDIDRLRAPLFFTWGFVIGMFSSWFYTFQNSWIPAEANLWTPSLRTFINRVTGATFGWLQSISLVRFLAIGAARKNGKQEYAQQHYSYFNQWKKYREGFLITAPLIFFNGYFIHNVLGSQQVIQSLGGDFRLLYGWSSGMYLGMIGSWIVNRPRGSGHTLWKRINFGIVTIAIGYTYIAAEVLSLPVHLSWGLFPLICLVYPLVLLIPEQSSLTAEPVSDQAALPPAPHIFLPKVSLEMAL